MRGRVLTLGTGLAVVLALAGCGSSSKKSETAATTTTAAGAGGVTVPPTSGGSGGTISVKVGDTKGLDGPMTMVVSPASAPAGDVTFVVENTGTIDHEVIVLKPAAAWDKLPIATTGSTANRIDESSNMGESDHVKPGATKSFTIKNMTAGNYALVCNIAKHYGLGMRAPFVVS